MIKKSPFFFALRSFCTTFVFQKNTSIVTSKSNVMFGKMQEHLRREIAEIREAGLYKEERIIESPQKAAISVKGKEVR